MRSVTVSTFLCLMAATPALAQADGPPLVAPAAPPPAQEEPLYQPPPVVFLSAPGAARQALTQLGPVESGCAQRAAAKMVGLTERDQIFANCVEGILGPFVMVMRHGKIDCRELELSASTPAPKKSFWGSTKPAEPASMDVVMCTVPNQ